MNILEKRELLLPVIIGPQEAHPLVCDLKTMAEAAYEVVYLLYSHAHLQNYIMEVLVHIIKTELKKIFSGICLPTSSRLATHIPNPVDTDKSTFPSGEHLHFRIFQ